MSFVRRLLWPLSPLYGAGARVRAWSYRAGIVRQKHLNRLVISVGNLTVGGAGKTPMVVWLGERLSQAGKMTAVLCRGYRPLPVRSASDDYPGIVEGWNDEAALLDGRFEGRVKIGASADRYEKGRELERLGAECFILDDGFQHLDLARDVDIVLIDATNPFDGGRLLPAGRLREPVSAIRRADIIVITRAEDAPAIEAVVRHTTALIFYAQTELLGVEAYDPSWNEAGPITRAERKFFAFCGIGNPAAFFDDLGKWGIPCAGHAEFRDHHWYTGRDIAELESRAIAAGANALLCTEKDRYDLMPLRSERVPIFFCKITLHFSDEDGLWRAICEVAERKRPGSLR